MKTLTIRNVPDRVHSALRLTAAAHGVSMEEEARRRLAQVAVPIAAPQPFDADRAAAARTRLWKMFEGMEHRSFVDEFLAEKRERARRELAT